MAISAGYKQENVDISIMDHVRDRMTALFPAKYFTPTRIFPQDMLGDPSALDERRTSLKYWIELSIINRGVGLKIPTIMQADCFYAVGSEGNQTDHDRYGHKNTEVADDLIEALGKTSGFLISDWVTPASPVATDLCLIVRNSRGQFGWPDSRDRTFNITGLNREVVTYHFWHIQDLHGPQAYFG